MDLELYFEQIEQYEEGSLSAAERLEFEAELTANADLRQALSLYRQAGEVVEQEIENSLRRQLQGWAGEAAPVAAPERPPARVVPMSTYVFRWAAAASVILLAGWFFFQQTGDYSNRGLFTAYYESPNPDTFRSGSPDANSLEPGFKAYLAGDFEAAGRLFDRVQPGEERYAEAQYYLGHTATQLGRYDQAVTAFQNAARSGEAKFTEKAEWNLVLAYLAGDQLAEAKAALARMVEQPEHSYYSAARELQKKLGSFRRMAD